MLSMLSKKVREFAGANLHGAFSAEFGHEIYDAFIDYQIAITLPMKAYKPSSMIDFVAGRPVEVEAIWGEPLRRAREMGVAVPRLEVLYERIVLAIGGS